jgi:hypothetical protein
MIQINCISCPGLLSSLLIASSFIAFRVATHLAVAVEELDENNLDLSVKILNKYLELEPVGPFIAGDLVLQGYSMEPNYAPAICKIEFLSNSDEHGEYHELSTIMPWEMIYQPGDEEGQPDSFAIPVTLPSDNLDGIAHLTVYVDLTSKIPHNEPSSDYHSNNTQLIAAIDFFTPVSFTIHSQDDLTPRPTTTEESMNHPSRLGSYSIITSIKSANMENSDVLFNSKYLIPCPVIDMRNGYRHKPDEEHDWRFSIAVERNDENTHLSGLEDAIFISRDEETGDLDVPEGYEVDSTNILEDCGEVVSVLSLSSLAHLILTGYHRSSGLSHGLFCPLLIHVSSLK